MVLVPLLVVTVMSTKPAVCAGDVAVIEVVVFVPMAAAGVAPNRTDVADPKLVPLIVTLVPPAISPDAGATPVIAGGGKGVTATFPELPLDPTALRAVTLQLYSVLLVRPVTVSGLLGPVVDLPAAQVAV
jgi:hypothetical protein